MATSSAQRVLILSASAGAGHVRAADALLKEFQTHPAVTKGGDAQHWDMLKYTTAMFRHLYSKTYAHVARTAPGVFGYVYNRTDTPWRNEKSRLLFEKFNALRFLKAVRKYEPDLIVCTHFTPPFLLSNLIERKEITVKPAVVVTDLDVHAMWLVRHYQRYFVALQESRVYLERVGITPERITVSGIPIDPVFRVAKDKTAARRALGLDPERCTLLFSAGGIGPAAIDAMLRELLRLQVSRGVQIVAVAGRSEDLKSKFDALAKETGPRAAVRIVPVGFTKQMDEYMAAADILISKPGGLTTAEALARGLPLCVVSPVPGQEERNSDHLLEAGVAIRCNNLPTLAWKIEQLLTTPGRLEAMAARARVLGQPHAAATIVRALLDS